MSLKTCETCVQRNLCLNTATCIKALAPLVLEKTLAERANRYGDFADVAQISQDMLDVARKSPGWARMNATQKEGTSLIIHKLARALSGDPNYIDNWHDIGGYAKLVEDRLTTT